MKVYDESKYRFSLSAHAFLGIKTGLANALDPEVEPIKTQIGNDLTNQRIGVWTSKKLFARRAPT